MSSHSSFLTRFSQVLITSFWVWVALFFVWPGFSHLVEEKGRNLASTVAQQPIPASILSHSRDAWRSLDQKVKKLQRLDEENAQLRLENVQIKSIHESEHFEVLGKQNEETTQKTKALLKRETGTQLGRVLESLNYQPPKDLLASQLYTLGVAYFNAKEDEKAAAIFSRLMSEDDDTFETAQNLLITGVSWYRLENYKLADSYFNRVLKQVPSSETLPFQAQARLWKALVSRRSHQKVKEQHWLKDLIDHHPHSMEAQWVNSVPEVTRETASQKKE